MTSTEFAKGLLCSCRMLSWKMRRNCLLNSHHKHQAFLLPSVRNQITLADEVCTFSNTFGVCSAAHVARVGGTHHLRVLSDMHSADSNTTGRITGRAVRSLGAPRISSDTRCQRIHQGLHQNGTKEVLKHEPFQPTKVQLLSRQTEHSRVTLLL